MLTWDPLALFNQLSLFRLAVIQARNLLIPGGRSGLPLDPSAQTWAGCTVKKKNIDHSFLGDSDADLLRIHSPP